MSNVAVLQLRLDAQLKEYALTRAKSLGFISLQEVLRVFLSSFVSGLAIPGIITTSAEVDSLEKFPAEHVDLGPKAAKRWSEILQDVNKGQNLYKFDNADKALNFLVREKNEDDQT